MRRDFIYCPRCATELKAGIHGGKQRQACPASDCHFVDWGSPTPVVAAIIERNGLVMLARGKGWPEKMFALVAGFLEAAEAPAEGVLREVKEETGLDGDVVSLVGTYPFEMRNEVIIAYHVRCHGEVTLSDELEAVKWLAPEKVRPWALGTGLAVRDWLVARGLTPQSL
jgi:NAD+ diphosphatase